VNGYAEAACGTCLVALRVGEPCGAPETTCGRTARCFGGVCTTTRRWIGASCTLETKGYSLDCDEELVCDRDLDGHGDGTCKRPPALGEPCRILMACAGDDTTCYEGRCTQKRIAELGEPCGLVGCGEGLFCRASDRTCQRGALPEGARCEDMLGIADCVPGTRCERVGEGTDVPFPQSCQRPVGVGASCDHHVCTDDAFCATRDGGDRYARFCQARRLALAPCTSSTECRAGLECRGKQCLPACASGR